jgi:hypothetical protein
MNLLCMYVCMYVCIDLDIYIHYFQIRVIPTTEPAPAQTSGSSVLLRNWRKYVFIRVF